MNSDSIIKFSGYFLWALTTIFSFLKIRYEINKRKEYEEKTSIRDKRFKIYSEYLSKLDIMNSELYSQQLSEESRRMANEVLLNIKNNPMDLESYYSFIKYQSDILIEYMERYNKYNDQISQLRLVGSQDLIALLDKYQQTVKAYLDINNESMIMHLMSPPGKFDFEIILKYANIQEELNKIRKTIENIMRKDIGNE